MKNILLTCALALLSLASWSESQIDSVMRSVEQNNTTLRAALQTKEAESLKAMSGIFMDNPEFEFSYLWSSEVGRIDVSLTQNLDFPSVYVQKRKIGKIGQEQAAISYRAARRDVLLRTKNLCVELVYLGAMERELTLRHKEALALADGYTRQLTVGEASLLQSNKAQMNLLSIETDLSNLKSQRTAALSELTNLNAGTAIDFTQESFESLSTLAKVGSFDEWFDQVARESPSMQYLASQITMQERQVKLSSAEGLPKLAVGYKSEAPMIAGEQFQGVVVGVSIPLWQNTNAVKAAKASLRATQSVAVDQKLQFYLNLRKLYDRTISLEKISEQFKSSYAHLSNTELLKKALAAGEISLLEYLSEMSLNYSLIDQSLATERDLNLTRSELFSFEL